MDPPGRTGCAVVTHTRLRIGLCQVVSTADPAENLALMRQWVRRAADAGARVVVFPEATMAHFGAPLAELAQPLDGPWPTAVADLADAHDVLIVAGMFTPAGDRIHNTVLLTGLGKHLGYNKIHLYDAFGYRESDTVAAGTDCVTVTVDGFGLGIATCYDVRFPTLFQRLAEQGASAVLLPTSWGAGDGKAEQWDILVSARALDTGCWVLGCDQADPGTTGTQVDPNAPTGIGRSVVIDPLGRIEGRLGAAPGLLIVDIDDTVVSDARAATGVLANRATIL
ncbi:carbon-nitrogen hydrolase family protein [Nocardia sp. NPDC059239]|uniref:carbon-nitrogen hydrolase family protein n=1 Tax=unclassified Nocardia TaxID=2637762 RepID=UPI0036973F4C